MLHLCSKTDERKSNYEYQRGVNGKDLQEGWCSLIVGYAETDVELNF
jgi:hypothetical protein